MKKGILCVFVGILFSTFYININSFQFLPSILCFAIIGMGTQICHKLAKSIHISNPALGISCVLIIGAVIETLCSYSDKMLAYMWIVEVFMMILYVYYLYAYLELLQDYAKKTEEPVPPHADRWEMAIVSFSTLMIILYCMHIFIPSLSLYYGYLGVGCIVRLCTFYHLIQWYRNSFAKGLR